MHVQDVIYKDFKQGWLGDVGENSTKTAWSFYNSVLFTISIITTIGKKFGLNREGGGGGGGGEVRVNTIFLSSPPSQFLHYTLLKMCSC